MTMRLLSVLCALMTLATGTRADEAKFDKDALRTLLEQTRKKHDVPALGAAVVGHLTFRGPPGSRAVVL